MGFYDRTVDQLPSPKAKYGSSAHGTGKNGGHTINLHQFASDGVILLGHIQDTDKDRVVLAPDLYDSLSKADNFEAEMVKAIDEYIVNNEMKAPSETLPELRDGYEQDLILELDLKSAGIKSVIWATGYKFNFNMVKLAVFDEDGYPVQKRGITEFPGIFFVGLTYLHTIKSGLLAGVGGDAAFLAEHIDSRLNPIP